MPTIRPPSAFGGTVSALIWNHLFVPGKDPVMMPFKLAAGQTLQAGSIMGLITASQEMVLSDASATDGSEKPRAILIEDLAWPHPTAQIFSLAVNGAFNEMALVYGPGHTPDTVRIPLRDRGIYLNLPRYSYA